MESIITCLEIATLRRTPDQPTMMLDKPCSSDRTCRIRIAGAAVRLKADYQGLLRAQRRPLLHVECSVVRLAFASALVASCAGRGTGQCTAIPGRRRNRQAS